METKMGTTLGSYRIGATTRAKLNLTAAMVTALRRAAADGMVAAGRLYVTRSGRGEKGTTASVLWALERRGLVNVYAHQDGGLAARLTVAGQWRVNNACHECGSTAPTDFDNESGGHEVCSDCEAPVARASEGSNV